MPVSRKGHAYFTQEQFDAAKQASALEYALSRGYDLMRAGSRYHLREHDSMVFMPDGRWYWNSQHKRGRALDFIIEYEGRSTVEAVLLLTEGNTPIPAATNMTEKKDIPFILPTETPQATGILIKYLTVRRCCDIDVVRDLIRHKRIYISCRTTENGVIRNAVFVGYDAAGAARSATIRGINYGSHFKGAVPGSDKMVPFEIPVSSASTLAVFEAPIDAISHATIDKDNGLLWDATLRIALGGNPAPHTVVNYLGLRPEIDTVQLCLDNDDGGKKMTAALLQELSTWNGKLETVLPPSGKDWNEYLTNLRNEEVK